MQVKEHVGRYASSAACARAVVSAEGWRALYRGFGATCARNCTFNGLYFGAIFAAQAALPPRATLAADAAQNLAVGAVSGVCATLVKAPFDVVKSRIQAQLPDAATGALRYRHTTQALLLVARTEGVRALWKGLGPMTLRIALGMSVSFAAFDAALGAMGAPRGAREAAAAAAAERTPREG
jgi:solute carrier family 25 2-oxodicarboxylate transporter 21